MKPPGSLAESFDAARHVAANRNLRRQQLAMAGSSLGEWSYLVALAVYAYQRGGTTAVGLTATVRLLPSAFAAPFAGALGDRYDRRRVMIASDLTRLVLLAAAAVATSAGGSLAVVLGLAILVAIAATAFRPAEAAILPSLARTPEELTAANAVSSTIGSAAAFAGPALGGLLLAASGVTLVFAATAATFGWSALMLFGIRMPEREDADGAGDGPRGVTAELMEGLRAVVSDRPVLLLTALNTAYFVVLGALDVLVVVAAIELLDLGQSGVGWLNAAIGVGSLAGSAVAIARVGRGRLALDLGIGLASFGLGLALVGVLPNVAVAVVLLALVGGATTVAEVATMTLMQRAVDDAVLARVFGIQETLILVGIAVGALIAPALVHLLDVQAALVAVGLLLPAITLAAWRPLLAIDRGARVPTLELELLRATPLFAPLGPAQLEQLAAALEPVAAAAGEAVIREGDPGDRFYVVSSGELEVRVGGRSARRIGAGDFFGEIALLRDVPRTATVTAVTDSRLLALEREPFLGAVTGHPGSAEAANAVIGARLGSVRTAGA